MLLLLFVMKKKQSDVVHYGIVSLRRATITSLQQRQQENYNVINVTPVKRMKLPFLYQVVNFSVCDYMT